MYYLFAIFFCHWIWQEIPKLESRITEESEVEYKDDNRLGTGTAKTPVQCHSDMMNLHNLAALDFHAYKNISVHTRVLIYASVVGEYVLW